jgi:hypothetical protein
LDAEPVTADALDAAPAKAAVAQVRPDAIITASGERTNPNTE